MLSQFTSIDKIRYNPQGTVPAILQDAWEGTVIGLIWMTSEAVQNTIESGQLWDAQGEQNPTYLGQIVQGLQYDPTSEALIVQIEPNEKTEDLEQFVKSFPNVLSELFAVICDRRDHPQAESYTCQLLAGGDNKILKKIGEESAEVVMACKDDEKEAIASEVADLFYHTLVALAHHQVNLRDVYQKLAQRRR
jgi:phosphoribosyl-ATP pyrophosphohydrolase/phosphoribosyl-AMP cyclohydrolase